MWIPDKLCPSILCPTLPYHFANWDRQRAMRKLSSTHTPLAPSLKKNQEFTVPMVYFQVSFIGRQVKAFFE